MYAHAKPCVTQTQINSCGLGTKPTNALLHGISAPQRNTQKHISQYEGREIRAPNLLIWSQTRCRCAIPPCDSTPHPNAYRSMNTLRVHTEVCFA